MKVIFVFAHPDDETFSSAGTIALLVKSGVTVQLVTATRGEAGQVGDPPLTTQENLGNVREGELKKVVKMLGISTLTFLDFIDGTLDKLPIKKLEDPILKILNKEKPDVVITFDKTGGSNHPDHIAISKATTQAFKTYMSKSKKKVSLYHTAVPRSYLEKYTTPELSYTAFGDMIGIPDEEITTIIDISKTYSLKVKTFACHQTQKKDWERYLKRAKVVDLKKEFFQLILSNFI